MNSYLHKRDTDYVRDNLIFNYCLGNEQDLLIESYIHNNHIDIRFDPHCFYFLITGTHKKFVMPYTPETFHKGVDGIFRMYTYMTQCLKENGYDGNVFLIKEDNSKQTGVLFSPSAHPSCTPEEMACKLQKSYEHGIHCSTSFSGPYGGYSQIHTAFRDARDLNDLYFFGIRNRVITKEFRNQTARPCDITAILANVRRLTSTLCTGTAKEALRQINYLTGEMVAPSYSYLNFAALCTAIDDVFGMFETVYPGHVYLNHRTLESFFTLQQYECWVKETTQMLYDQLQDVKRYSPTLLMVLSFINRNYTTDLSLSQLAEYAYTNASVLSSEFNDEVGMSLSEYVTGLRIKKAQDLLRTSDMTVAQIAVQAGFSSAKYFREIFKKQTGMSPQQYRDQ